MRRSSWIATVLLLLGLSLIGYGTVASSAPKRVAGPDQSPDRAVKATAAEPAAAKLDNFKLVGHTSLDGFQDYGDLYAHGDYAYVGSRCGSEAQGGDGVQVVDISDPRHPRVVSTLPNPAFTRAEDLTVLDVRNKTFRGVLAVVGIQACFGSGHEAEVVPGLRFFDVTHPRHPVELGHWDTPQGTIGCHELDAAQRADGTVLAACARNLIDHIGTDGAVAIHLVDVTDPAKPELRADFTRNDAPEGGVGCLPFQFAHSARFYDRGQSLYVSYWDSGTVHLDISKPAAPAVVSTTKVLPRDEDGDQHSMTLADRGRLLLVHTEDFSPGDCPDQPEFGAWGEVYVYDNRDQAHPAFLGTFSTPNGRSTRSDGTFTDHNTEVANGNQLFSSWYSDGIVWWTANTKGSMRQIGQFTPPANADGSPPLVWGVFVDSEHDLILGSDINSGLWIVKPKGLGRF